MNDKINDDNDDYLNKLTYLFNDFNIVLGYNPMIDNKLYYININVENYKSISREDIKNALKLIFIAVNKDISEDEILEYVNDLFERLYKSNNDDIDIDKVYSEYRVEAYSDYENGLLIAISKNY